MEKTECIHVLLKHLSQEQANTCVLVLTSSGIIYNVRKSERGWDILIRDEDYENAVNSIREYTLENQEWFREKSDSESGFGKTTISGIIAAFILLSCHVIMNHKYNTHDLAIFFGASASHIVDGELFRSITSLMLHADGLHLLGNMAGIAIFGAAVCTISGEGLGWLMILLSGSLGNIINAYFYKTGHLALGPLQLFLVQSVF